MLLKRGMGNGEWHEWKMKTSDKSKTADKSIFPHNSAPIWMLLKRGMGNGEWHEWKMKTGESGQWYEIWGHDI